MRLLLFSFTAMLALPSSSASAQESKYHKVQKGDYSHDGAARPSGGGCGTPLRTPALPSDPIRLQGRSTVFLLARIPRRKASLLGRMEHGTDEESAT